ncbi:COX assembly mitochondrial protein homolog [Venturia canescens]|uniref:COX assembly mitochondrial protein homolog n=1 Tax=Venturia canescens TaxID=32260 RepID=UPI001C9D4804|nr:COX assembly mitochondrial protein homolog [Venturia canescens]
MGNDVVVGNEKHGLSGGGGGSRLINNTMAETAETNDNNNKKKLNKSVLPKHLGGGPHGLGDPDDKSLRKIERDVVIMQKVRERTKAEKCHVEWRAFGDCAAENKLLMPFLCRKENTILRECCERWYKDEAFVKECTEQYLEERSEYRRTGITKKQKQFANRMSGGLS